MLGHGGQDVHREPVGLREVYGRELDPALHEVRYERYVAGEAIELRDDESGAV